MTEVNLILHTFQLPSIVGVPIWDSFIISLLINSCFTVGISKQESKIELFEPINFNFLLLHFEIENKTQELKRDKKTSK